MAANWGKWMVDGMDNWLVVKTDNRMELMSVSQLGKRLVTLMDFYLV